jgi:ribose/xylose/arabinose/galactoside ABC-type transport system permease subunit
VTAGTETTARGWHLDPRILYTGSRLFVLVLLCIVMTVASPVFLTGSNALNVLRVASLLVILGIGQTIVILTAGIDLSIGSVLTFSSVIAALAIKAGVPLPLALAAGLVVGAALGFLNGLMVAVVKLPAFIATYGMMWVAAGFAVVLLKGHVIYGFEDDFRFLGVGNLLGVPMPIVVMAFLWVPSYLLLRHTTFGRSLYAVGEPGGGPALGGQEGPDVDPGLHVERIHGGRGRPGLRGAPKRLGGGDRRQHAPAGDRGGGDRRHQPLRR